jgi:RimJ/RimL family protein N-acetyltransferase
MSDILYLETERLILEKVTFSDAVFIKTLFNDPDCLRFIGDKQIADIPSAERYIETGPLLSYQQHGFGLLKVVKKASRDLVGCCGLLQRDYLPCPDIGFAALPDFRGQGYLYEAASSILQRVKEVGCYPSIEALVDPDNSASIQLLKKLGFTYLREITPAVDGRKTNVYGICTSQNKD